MIDAKTYRRHLANLSAAWEALISNPLRTVLTTLGIIFGVAAVIAMLAIGNGAQQEVLEQIRLVGVNNIVIQPVVEQTDEQVEEDPQMQNKGPKFSPGLTLEDVASVQEILPTVSTISPEVEMDVYVINDGFRRSSKLVGVLPVYFDLFNLSLARGQMFSEKNLNYGDQVCVIGHGISARFFSGEDPVGKYLKCGRNWLKVIGVLEPKYVSDAALQNDDLGIRNADMEVYTPLKTMLMRYKNRALVTQGMIRQAAANNDDDDEGGAPATPQAPSDYHQLNKLVVQVDDTEYLLSTADVLSRLLKRRHMDVVDYQVSIPIQLLQQQKRTNDIFNYVITAIALISLIVGGIGIMNIMLASVLERIREIGLRLSLGAKKSDIVAQFLFESIMMSLTGGAIGVFIGVMLAYAVQFLADMQVQISFTSVVGSFGFAAAVGLIFGIAPARRAANQNPIESLRYQ